MMKKELLIDYIAPVVIALILFLFALSPAYHGLGWAFYDFFLKTTPGVPEEPNIVIVNIDDDTIERMGIYPLTRDLIAQGLKVMGEFQGRVVAIDSEFIDRSPRGVREDFLTRDLAYDFEDTFVDLNNAFSQLLDLISSGRLPMRELGSYVDSLSEYTAQLQEQLYSRALMVIRDNDEYLGRNARFFGQAIATITPQKWKIENKGVESVSISDDFKRLIHEQIALKNIRVMEDHPFLKADTVSPAIHPIMAGMVGAGNVEQYVDADGVRRRVDLLFEWEGSFFPQLGFAAALEYLDFPPMSLYKDKIIIHASTKDIIVPLDPMGRMIIRWVPKNYVDSFSHIPFYPLIVYDNIFNEFFEDIQNLRQVYEPLFQYMASLDEDFSYPDPNSHWGDFFPNAAKAQWEEALEYGKEILDLQGREVYAEVRSAFFSAAQNYLQAIPRELLYATVQDELEMRDSNDPSYDFFMLANDLFFKNRILETLDEKSNRITQLREELTEKIKDNILILGYSGKSTTDIGVNPFEKEYMNVGTMANVANTIFSGWFVDSWHWGFSFLFIFPLSFLIPWMMAKMSPTKGSFTGLALLAGVFTLYYLIFLFFGLYLDLGIALLLIALNLIFSVGINFRRTGNQRAFIKDAFGQYLSEDVVAELLDNPDKLKLGGENREMSAIFTDVKGFSTISEQMSAVDLVTLLNHYLTGMSDTLMQYKGTIDKYEGDAIIGFFGAPGFLPNHAELACKAALDMKKLEYEMNKKFLQEGISPFKLLTRIGINTGEMVVGNMGTEKMKNYTMMGNHVNLAARLEGVNKQYQTWILISEYTKNKISGDFFTRMVDKVRVVGISTPIKLYELIGYTQEVSDQKKEIVDLYTRGLGYFDAQDFGKAKDLFAQAIKLAPWDGPSQKFYKRSQMFIKEPPKNFDGVFNLTEK